MYNELVLKEEQEIPKPSSSLPDPQDEKSEIPLVEEESKDARKPDEKSSQQIREELLDHEKECQSKTARVQEKFIKIKDLVKSQLELKRLIKRN